MSKPNEIIPIALFFGTYAFLGLIPATQVLVSSTAFFMIMSYLKSPKPLKSYTSGLLVIGLGGLSLITHNPVFLVWKPTVMYTITAVAILAGQIIYQKSLSEKLFSSAGVTVKDYPWKKLDITIAAIFSTMAIANLQVYRLFGLDSWVKFKFMSLIAILALLLPITYHIASKAEA